MGENIQTNIKQDGRMWLRSRQGYSEHGGQVCDYIQTGVLD
jgi:hypothetical protein